MKDFPLIRSQRAAIIGTLLIAAPMLLLSLSPLTGVYAALLSLFLLPTALCLLGLTGGLIPMLVSALLSLCGLYRFAGQAGALLGAVYLLPVMAVFLFVVARRVPFWHACAGMIGAHVAALAAAYLILQSLAGGDLYTAAGAWAAAAVEKWAMCDQLLFQLYDMGAITLPETLRDSMLSPMLGGYTLSAAARADLLLSVRSLVSSSLASLTPSLIIRQSILGGVGCLLLPLRFGAIAAQRRAFRSEEPADAERQLQSKPDFPNLNMPPLSMWFVPRGYGWQLGLMLVAGYVLGGSAASGAAIAGRILYAAANAVFTIQGLAVINFMQKARGVKLARRVIVPALLLLFSILPFLGIFDQVANIRGLRKPKEPKEDS